MKLTTQIIARNALIASIYCVLVLITYPISFLGIQFRIAEILILLCFFRRDYVLGLTVGCAVANLASSIGPIDAIFGIVTTLIAGLLISVCKQLIVAIFIPVIVNGFIVGLELYWILKEPFWISVGTVALGELVVLAVGYAIFMILKNRKFFYDLIKANRNIDYKF